MQTASQSHSKMSWALCSVQEHLLAEGRCPQHTPAGSTGCHTTDLRRNYKPTHPFSNWSKRPRHKIHSHLQRTFFPPKLMTHFALWTSWLTNSVRTDPVSHLSNLILETQIEQVLGAWCPCQLFQKIVLASLHKDLKIHFCHMKLLIGRVVPIQALSLHIYISNFFFLLSGSFSEMLWLQ